MASITADIVPFNRTEHAYAAIEGLAGTMIQPYLLRLSAPVDALRVKRVLRQLVTLYPKLRATIEPGLHQYHFRILPDDRVVDQLFELAFEVVPHIHVDNPAELLAWHRRCMHHVVPLEKGIGLRAWYVPHPERPVLMFGVPHIFGDGMTMLHLVKQCILGINGLPMEAMPIEAPSMVGAIAPEHWWQWPGKIMASRRHKVAERQLLAGLHVQQLPRQPQPNHATSGLSKGSLPVPVADLRKASRKLGVSLNTFLTAAIAETFLSQAPNDPKAAAVIRTSVDMRRYYPKSAGHGPLWGNHVGAFLVIEQGPGKSVQERVRAVDASVKEGQARFARREMAWAYLFEELMPWLGRTLIGHVIVKMRRNDRFPLISAHATSLGDVCGYFNPKEAPIQVEQFSAAVNSISPIIGLMEANSELLYSMIWQESETSGDAIEAFCQRLGATIQRMVQDAETEG